MAPFHVYEIIHDGSEGKRRLGDLYLNLSDAKAEVERLRQEWVDMAERGDGRIFGDVKIQRLRVL